MAYNLEKFSQISPFSYEVNANGTLRDSLKINEGFWPTWLSALHDANVKIIPTVALLYGNAIQKLLSNKTSRIRHENIIAALVKKQKFDGIDIDYEDKMAKTRPYFSTFLFGLNMRLHAMKKTLSCTIEGRTPIADQFAVVPENFSYANDYAAINKYCDEVRIMAYDQGNIDLKLDAEKGNGQFYMPVADAEWVEKVIKETVKTISPKKIMLGVPTYGYMYEVSQNNGVATYKRLRSVTYDQAIALADSVKAVPVENNAGELGFTYATSTPVSVSKNLTYTMQANLLLNLQAVANPAQQVIRYVTFSDANGIEDKIKLAKKYNLKGIEFFKMDGEVDPAVWDKLK